MLNLNEYQKYALIIYLIEKSNSKHMSINIQRLHKILYFLQEEVDIPFDYKFCLYKHGVYSFEIKRAIEIMQAYKYIKLECYNDFSTAYEVGKDSLLKTKSATIINKYTKSIDYFIEEIKSLDLNFLEIYSAYHYVSKKYPELLENDLVNKVIELQNWIDRRKLNNVVIQQIKL